GQINATMLFSPHGAHMAYAAERGSRWVVSYDGVDGARFDEILNIGVNVYGAPGTGVSSGEADKVGFSPDGTRYFYIGRQGQEFVLMVDGKEMFRTPVATTSIRPVPLAPNGFDPSTVGVQRSVGGFTPDSKHVFFTLHTQRSLQSGENYDQLL